ncbi:hypothetical protein GOZ94_11505 [Agrobacterium vitis]|uniref:hypothetical protein n=1 Tax=Agrobacterium vitis TaxID=373 RepID=UPI0012E96673|nr:hypothetical protein [Agrobacterium vitis]MVA19574.1 hypothetical protein [Agrobacterium vitis]
MTEEKPAKRKIDRIRDGAGMLTIGDESDGAVISAEGINHRLYVIKEEAIYVIALADQIDPDRTREDIPNTVQKIADIGAKSEVVQKTFLTGLELFKKQRLIDSVPYETALLSVIDIMNDLAAADAVAGEIQRALLRNREKQVQPKQGALALPSYPSLRAETKTFIQKMDHAMQGVFNLCALFYGEENLRKAAPWLDGVHRHLIETLPDDDEFIKFADALASFGKLVRNARHCIEHPKTEQQLTVNDYRLTANRELLEPEIGVIHKATPIEAVRADEFFRYFIENALVGCETLMAFLAGRHMAGLGGFEVVVGEIPEAQRRSGVRYGYLVNLGGNFSRLG